MLSAEHHSIVRFWIDETASNSKNCQQGILRGYAINAKLGGGHSFVRLFSRSHKLAEIALDLSRNCSPPLLTIAATCRAMWNCLVN